ncbi:MAG: hypothetical protein NVSMB24_38500 [Mucilaginibacter sp.]
MKRIKKAFAWLKLELGFGPDLKIRLDEDIPAHIRDGAVYIIGGASPWLLLLRCPCGCGETIHLNLLKEASPRWGYRVVKKTITVKPSIWRTTGCKSHFIIRNGQVQWVK